MECLYCHKKFSSFRFWKGSKFCSKEHEEAYRDQTLSRLMDSGGVSDKQPLPFDDSFENVEAQPQIAASEYSGARQIEAPPAGSPARDAGTFELPPAGTYALGDDPRMSTWRADLDNVPSDAPSSDKPTQARTGEVHLQTPEEALNALRELAKGAQSSGQLGQQQPPVPLPQPERSLAEGESPAAADDIDTDDVFAELRRMAEATGKVEQVPEGEETIDLPTAPEGFSALDRLMEASTPRAGVGKPRLDRREGIEPPLEKPASTTAHKEKEAPVEVAKTESEDEAELVRDETPERPAAELTDAIEDEPVPVKAEGDSDREEVDEKVVSFPGPKHGGRDAGHKMGRMARLRGATSGLFDSGIHDEFVAVNLSNLLRETSVFPPERAVAALDETLRAPDAGSCTAPARNVTPKGVVGAYWPLAGDLRTVFPAADIFLSHASLARETNRDVREPRSSEFRPPALPFVAPERTISPVGQWESFVPAALLREVNGRLEFPVEHHPEPNVSAIKPNLPVGLAKSMGVLPPNRGQLIRSELFTKEPEVREYTDNGWEDAAAEIHVRRVYNGHQGTA